MSMPITTHIVKVEKDNTIKIPKTICDALGIVLQLKPFLQ